MSHVIILYLRKKKQIQLSAYRQFNKFVQTPGLLEAESSFPEGISHCLFPLRGKCMRNGFYLIDSNHFGELLNRQKQPATLFSLDMQWMHLVEDLILLFHRHTNLRHLHWCCEQTYTDQKWKWFCQRNIFFSDFILPI